MEDTPQLALSDCFELGRALRSCDAESFCKVYDSLILPATNSEHDTIFQLKLSSIKEVARQISELDKEDYINLEQHFPSLGVLFDIYEPITIQLSVLIDNLNSEGPSDSGAVSDYDGAVSDYDSSAWDNADVLRSGSNSSIISCKEDKKITEKVNSAEFDEVSDVQPCLEDLPSDNESISDKDHVLPVEDTKSIELIPPEDTKPTELIPPEDTKPTELIPPEDTKPTELIPPEDTKLTELIPPEDTKSTELIPPAIGFSIDESSMELSRIVESNNNKHNGNDTFGEFWSKIKDKSEEEEPVTNSKTESTIDKEENEAIMVTDLEKEFFSSDSGPSLHVEQHRNQQVYLNIRRKPGILRSRTTECTNKRSPEDQKYTSYVSETTRFGTKGQRPATSHNNFSSSTAPYENRHYRRWGYRQNHRDGIRRDGRYNKFKENNFNGLSESESQNELLQISDSHRVQRDESSSVETPNKPSSHCIEKQGKCLPPSHQTSPLVLQSQNMWSSNIDIIKSSIRKTSTTKECRDTERPTVLFNHYEVGCFLLEGWEKAQRELVAL